MVFLKSDKIVCFSVLPDISLIAIIKVHERNINSKH